MNKSLSPRVLDASLLLLLLTTGATWLVFEGTLHTDHQPAVLIVLMMVKSALILAIFMDLWLRSRLMLVAMLAFMGLIGAGIVAQVEVGGSARFFSIDVQVD